MYHFQAFLLFNGVEELKIISKVNWTLEVSLESIRLFINSSTYDQNSSMYEVIKLYLYHHWFWTSNNFHQKFLLFLWVNNINNNNNNNNNPQKELEDPLILSFQLNYNLFSKKDFWYHELNQYLLDHSS